MQTRERKKTRKTGFTISDRSKRGTLVFFVSPLCTVWADSLHRDFTVLKESRCPCVLTVHTRFHRVKGVEVSVCLLVMPCSV